MTPFTNIPKQVEQSLEYANGTTSRRNFLKNAGLLVVSVSASGSGALIPAASAQTPAAAQAAGLIPTRTFDSSIRGSSFTRTTQRPSTSGKRT